MAKTKKIVILGGGYGGVEAAKKLAKRYKRRSDVELTLIDKLPYHCLMTELHEVAGHRVPPDAVRVPFAKIFAASKVKLVTDNIETIDFQAKLLRSAVAEYQYDLLVIATGAEPEFFGLPGVAENAFTLWSYDDAIRIRHHLEAVFEKAVAEPDPAKRRQLLTFVVAGAGFTGVEMVGELTEWRDAMCAKWLVDPTEVKLKLIEALPNILPILEAKLVAKAEARLRKKQVELLTAQPIVSAGPGVVKLKDGSQIETDTFIWTCGVNGSCFAGQLDLTKADDRSSRLLATTELRSVDYAEVFLVGDAVWLIENDQPLPQIVETALQTAQTAVRNIVAAIDGGEPEQFSSNYHGFMVSIGGKYAVSNAGGLKISGFFAMVMKHLINLHYLFGLAGFNQCWEYLKHEFLDMESGRSILRGFGAYRTRGYWLLPLRLWLGLMWFMEGLNKIGEGWLAWSSGTKSAWMFSPGVVQAGLGLDATTAASELVEPAVQAVTGATTDAVVEAVTAASELLEPATQAITNLASDALTAASDWLEPTAQAVRNFDKFWDLTKPILASDNGLVNWFRTVFMDGLFAHLPFQAFQLMIVMMEILIGLALMGGLLTWWAAVASIVMCLIFTLSGMFAWQQLWFVFSAVLLMGGGGRAFGLDCWLVPLCKRWWNGRRWVRRRYCYLDLPTKK